MLTCIQSIWQAGEKAQAIAAVECVCKEFGWMPISFGIAICSWWCYLDRDCIQVIWTGYIDVSFYDKQVRKLGQLKEMARLKGDIGSIWSPVASMHICLFDSDSHCVKLG